MKKINPVKKFFQDYPIIWVIIIILTTGWAVTYLLTQPNPIFHRHIAHSEPIEPALVPAVQPITKSELSVAQEIQTAVPAVPVEKLAVVPEPVLSELVSAPAPAVPPAKKPQIVFVIDDLGYSNQQAELLFSITCPLTISILPQLTYSKYFAEEGKKRGFETLLHQPLEPESKTQDPGPGLITAAMTVEQMSHILEENFLTVPDVSGVNNHMGSLATRDRRVMYVVAKELKQRNLFFLDSMTHPKSVGYNVTFALGIPTAKRDVFLDNQDDYNLILEQIQETVNVAKQNGHAVAIGHIRKNTLQAIKDSVPKLEAEGFEITSLRKLTKQHVIARSPEGTTKQSTI